MKVIHKFDKHISQVDDLVVFTINGLVEVLSVVNQNESLCLYAIRDTNDKTKSRVILRIVCTGAPLADDNDPAATGKFLGTLLFRGGEFVVHVFRHKSDK